LYDEDYHFDRNDFQNNEEASGKKSSATITPILKKRNQLKTQDGSSESSDDY
jgi:hypothetical protein